MKIVRPLAITDAALTSNVPETDYPEYNPATPYDVDVFVIVIGTTHKIYQSLAAANDGHDPATSPTWWLDRGAVNRWKMFDTEVDSQTVHNDDIEFTLEITGRCNAIALLNVFAASVHVVATDAIDGVVFDRTINMQSAMGINDWWSYFYELPEWRRDMVITDLPLYTNLTLTVTMSNISGVTKCGMAVIGITKVFGDTSWGTRVGITDHSTKARDTWGNTTVVKRSFNKNGHFLIDVDNSLVDNLETLLAEYRGTPILYIGSALFGSTMIFGFYNSFDIVIKYLTVSVCNIEIEGLI